MCAFSYMSKGPLTFDMSYMEISPTGELLFEIPFMNKYLCMMHDFGVTEDYVAFAVMPLVTSLERLEKRMPYFGFDPSLPTWFAVLPRRAGATAADLRWFRAPSNCFVGHVMNAFNDGTKLYFDMPVAARNSFPFFPDVTGAPFDPIGGLAHLTRWTVDMASNSDELQSVEVMTHLADEFPRIDDRYATRPYRHGWMLVLDRDKPYEGPGGPFIGVINSLAHIDLSTGETKTWWPGAQCGIQEPCFIPRSAMRGGRGLCRGPRRQSRHQLQRAVLFRRSARRRGADRPGQAAGADPPGTPWQLVDGRATRRRGLRRFAALPGIPAFAGIAEAGPHGAHALAGRAVHAAPAMVELEHIALGARNGRRSCSRRKRCTAPESGESACHASLPHG